MDKSFALVFLFSVIYLFCDLPTSESGHCWQRPRCNSTIACPSGWVCLKCKCYRCKCREPEQCYLVPGTHDVACNCPADASGDHCDCPSTNPANPCESGWLYGLEDGAEIGTCYLFAHKQKGWEDANQACGQKNAMLLTVKTVAKHEKITELYADIEGADMGYWIGGRYDDLTDSYQWLDESSVSEFAWAPTMPGDITGCMAYREVSDLLWIAESDCYEFQLPYICEKPAP